MASPANVGARGRVLRVALAGEEEMTEVDEARSRVV
jgi:hypothetical protein